jgi:dCTP deaminase
MLSKPTILRYVASGRISVRPAFDEQQLRPSGIRVHLGQEILVPNASVGMVDLTKPIGSDALFCKRQIVDNPHRLGPGDFVLASTMELFQVSPEISCRLDGRSTLARMGIMIHCSSDTIDNNHSEHRSVVLEIKNIGPFDVGLQFGVPIAMLTFQEMSEAVNPSEEQQQYSGQVGVTGPNLNFSVPKYVAM